MAADYRHIGGLENRLGRHYSRFFAFWPAPALAGQSLALRKLCDAGSNRRSRVSDRQGEPRRASSGVFTADTAPHPRLFPLEDTPLELTHSIRHLTPGLPLPMA
jgi:hypothetical protein